MSGKRSALIVATSDYHDTRLTKLDGPGHDAEALSTVLANAEIGGFEVSLALNSPVDTLRRTLESFFTGRARDDLLLVHFSGHGLKDDDGQLYLAAADTEIDRLLSTGVDAAWVNRLMSKCRSEKIALFLDCCFAGAFTSGMARRVGVDTAGVKEQFNGSGLFVIAASDAMQYSFEGGQQVGQPPEPSPFTKALVDGLLTGEADRNEDGVVSINELFDYLEDRIRETSPSQTPTKSAFNQVGDWAIAQSTRAPSVRLLPEALQQQLKSENPFDRVGTLMELRDILRGADPRLADAALQAVERLAQDDSRSVAAKAQRLLEAEAARPGSTAHVTGSAAVPTPTILDAAVVAEAIAVTSAPREPVAPIPPAAPEPAPAAVAPPMAPKAPAAPEPAVAPAAPAVAPPPEPTRPKSPWGQVHEARPSTAGVPESLGQAFSKYASGDAAGARHDGTAGIPWSLGRAGVRAGIGAFVWLVLQYFWVLVSIPDIFLDSSRLEFITQAFGELAVLITAITAVTVALVEQFVPALRLPGGSAYRVVGGNRWAAAAILGAVVGLVIGFVVEGAYFQSMDGLGLEIPLCAALGFLVAELLVGRGSRGRREEGSRTA